MTPPYSILANASIARIKSNFSIRKLSAEDMQALDSLAIPGGLGRTVDFTEQWGIPLFQN
jgi:enhancing lycopene biosynthesis protein 2